MSEDNLAIQRQIQQKHEKELHKLRESVSNLSLFLAVKRETVITYY